MNKEDYVSLEVAKLLEEKGYDEPCSSRYIVVESGRYIFERCNTFDIKKALDLGKIKDGYLFDSYLAPKLYNVQKWLRNKYNLNINIIFSEGSVYSRLINDKYTLEVLYNKGYRVELEKNFSSYEEALNAGILEALKLI